MKNIAEWERLREAESREVHWRRWGPFVSDRQWGTVREDYSADGDAWEFVTYERARSYAYRWGEDGIAGISDNHQRLCFAPAFWNGHDPALKERFFGLSNPEGNHGEDVKECYWHLDATPTHSYLKFLYRYPGRAFPYERLREENAKRGLDDAEFELPETGVFDRGPWYDITIEYAKDGSEEIAVRIHAVNRGDEAGRLTVLPTVWFRNTWRQRGHEERPVLGEGGDSRVHAKHETLGDRWIAFAGPDEVVFTENETNPSPPARYGPACGDADRHDDDEAGEGSSSGGAHYKDGFHTYVVGGDADSVVHAGSGSSSGTRAAAIHRFDLAPGESATVYSVISDRENVRCVAAEIDVLIETRRAEADQFYGALQKSDIISEERREIQRRAWAGMIWCKQFYYFWVDRWLKGDPDQQPVPESRARIRNIHWKHMYCEDILSMPDSWEYPWFAVWDSAFHAMIFADFDPFFAKLQVRRFTREWFMHPNGQLPAYEWNFSDVNPPVHARAAWNVYRTEYIRYGTADLEFLQSVFHKLLMNFTWWVNRKDREDQNVFEGGFLGLDNIGVFDRSKPVPGEGYLEQIDSTAWMAMYCLDMLMIAWELAVDDPAYEDIASKFFEHYLSIASAIYDIDGTGSSLWDEEDGFFYDQIHRPDGSREKIRLRTIAGLTPMFAVELLEISYLKKLPDFKRRMDWFYRNRPDLANNATCLMEDGDHERGLMSIVSPERLKRLLARMLDENEFLSPYGIRSLSKEYEENPYHFASDGFENVVGYEPGESSSSMFGGNSNWRGPVWLPLNYLIVQSLRRYNRYLGATYTVEFPTGSGHQATLAEVADDLTRRLIALFERDGESRPYLAGNPKAADPAWRDHLLFYEYFHGDTGAGLGASHQTGWTGLVAALISQLS